MQCAKRLTFSKPLQWVVAPTMGKGSILVFAERAFSSNDNYYHVYFFAQQAKLCGTAYNFQYLTVCNVNNV
ncbi:hypothetical protein EDC52_106182 [Biostraticola tofi]|uniref:Uncharacterized protein n=1 Tax=Biostraticola tofi TaxID=466109 RepID=A0A4R3YS19_9GAMM|nr:hypothetical protein EDC52_106182 [Biostraticola tofi]